MTNAAANTRYATFPQMSSYDRMASTRYIPFAIVAGPVNMSDQRIRTDSRGYRLSRCGDDYISPERFDPARGLSLVLGGSTAFGVGSSSDDTTLPSILSSLDGGQWLNLGVRGAVSIQELLHLIQLTPRLKNVENIVFFSGVNDIYVNFLSDAISDFDSRFDESVTDRLMYSPSRYLACQFLAGIYGCKPRDLLPLPKKELLLYPFKHRAGAESAPQLTVEDRLANLAEIYERNFAMYAALQKQFSCNVVFALQPFFPWTGKQASAEEMAVFSELEAMQEFTKFLEVKNAIGQERIYREFSGLIEKAAARFGVSFVDVNRECGVADTLFCDQVHLVDGGYQAAAKSINARLALSPQDRRS